MARIPDELIEQLKARVSLERLAEGRGVVFTRHGADLIGRCPFHDDRTPSLVITPSKNLWHCLGACQAGGTVIDWVMRAEGVSFRHAVELLQNDYWPLAASENAAPVVKRATVRKLAAPLDTSAEDGALLKQVIEYYHQTLLANPEALAYLKQRGIDSPEAIRTFKLGFANRTLGYRLPEKNRLEGQELRGRLQRIGIYRASGHEHFNGSLVIPIINTDGEVTEAYGRKITAGLREGTPLHLYLPGPHRGVWNGAALRDAKEIILCESLIDALTFWCAGYRNVTASYGVEGFTADHLALLKYCGAQRVFIAYDRDEAGDRAAEKLAAQLMPEGFDCHRVLFPKGIDANEYALKVTPATQSLGLALRSAHWLGKGAKPASVVMPMPTAPVANERPVMLEAASSSLAASVVEKKTQTTEAISTEPPAPIAAADESAEATIDVREQELSMVWSDRRWRARELGQATAGQLKVNVLVSRGDRFHVDTLDLYCARLRAAYLKQASVELGLPEETIKRDLGAVLLKLEALQAERIEEAQRKQASTAQPTISMEDKTAALALLRDARLTARIVEDLTACGVVGEEANKLVAYLACLSRQQEKPLAVVIQSTSAAGKSTLMEAVLSLMPSEARVHYSAMTGQSLFYMGEVGLKHKILAIAEEQGVQEAAYALKLLQSQGELTIASTGKDPVSGRLVTHEYQVEGPVMLFLTTTAIEVDEELMNRCLVLTVNESREQTRAIHQLQRQRRTLAGLLERRQRDSITRLHQNAQRLLRPLPVVNPYAEQLSFADRTARMRRDHEKYLGLIEAVALLHQYQREIKVIEHEGAWVEYIEVTRPDIALANRLAEQVLNQSLDELPPQTQRLLACIERMVTERTQSASIKQQAMRFTRRELREYSGFGHTQLRLHLDRLASLEYLLVHRGERGLQFLYELNGGSGSDSSPPSALLDVNTLSVESTTIPEHGGAGQSAGDVRPPGRGMAGHTPHASSAVNPGVLANLAGEIPAPGSASSATVPSYRTSSSSLAASSRS